MKKIKKNKSNTEKEKNKKLIKFLIFQKLKMVNENIQSVRIRKTKTLEEAEKMVKQMGYKTLYRGKRTNQLVKGESKDWWRFRQVAPTKYDPKSFRTKVINKNVELIIGKLKKS